MCKKKKLGSTWKFVEIYLLFTCITNLILALHTQSWMGWRNLSKTVEKSSSSPCAAGVFSQFLRPRLSRQPSGVYKNGRSWQRLISLPPRKNLVCPSPFSLKFYLFWQNGPLIFGKFLQQYYLATSKEYIALDKTAKQDFKLEIWFNLLPGNAESFAAELEKYSKQYGYGFLFNIPTVHQVDPSNANNITYINPIHMLETWNKMIDNLVANNANEIWGMHNWTTPPPNIKNQVAEITNTCGKIGVANAVTCIGQKKILEQWKPTILSHQIMRLLTPEAQVGIKIPKQKF